jgi:hypothetical protein
MYAWSFDARTVDEVARVLRALGKHRYVREADLRLHWSVDEALADDARFAPHAAAFRARLARDQDLDPSSRDPSLWRPAPLDDVLAALTVFWTPGEAQARASERLLAAIARTGLPPAEHAPWSASPDDPPHPELVLLDWELLPVEELDTERHAGALSAMEDAGEEVSPSHAPSHEGPILAAPELTRGAPSGLLPEEMFFWADGAYSYASYVFRGVARAAKLDPPVGYHDL